MRCLSALLFSLSLTSVLVLSRDATAAEYPEEYSQRPQTLPERMLELKSGVALDVSAARSTQPTLGFGFRWGITNGLEFELGAAFTKVPGLLLNTESASLRGILWHSDSASLSFGGGLQLFGVSGGESAVFSFADIGFYARLGERAGIRVSAGVTNPWSYRNVFVDTYGLAVEPSFNITPAFATYIRLGGNAQFRDVETASGRVAAGLMYTLDARFDFAASFELPNLVSRGGLSADERVVAVDARWRFDFR